jgi:rhombotail lipoprotein
MNRAPVILALLLSTGCSFSPRGIDQGALARAARVDRFPVKDVDIENAISLHSELGAQFKVAVWFRPPTPWRWSEHRFAWDEADREVVADALGPLLEAKVITELIPLPDALFPDESVRGARFAAARQGADAVLVVTGAAGLESYSNAAALLYPTIVGLWLAPGTQADGVCFVAASLWDVRSGFLYLAAETRGVVHRRVPYMHLDEVAVADAARKEAVGDLAKELAERLARLKKPSKMTSR